MWLFHSSDKFEGYNMYSLKKYVDKKRIALYIIMVMLIIVTLIFTAYYLIDTQNKLKKEKQYVDQAIEIQNQIEEQAKQEEEKKSKIPELTEVGKENMKHIYSSENKRAFLTFDDGPSVNTNKILDILNQYEIKATFFVLGSQVEANPETIRRIYKEGHYIANHGYSHKYSLIYTSTQTVLDEYNKCNEIVAKTIGVPEYNSHLFRFPGGSVGGKYAELKKQAITLFEQNNIMYVDWNALTGDSEQRNPSEEYLMNNLQKTIGQKQSVVILMHDTQTKEITVDTLPKVIDYLKEQGYEFENFYNIIK